MVFSTTIMNDKDNKPKNATGKLNFNKKKVIHRQKNYYSQPGYDLPYYSQATYFPCWPQYPTQQFYPLRNAFVAYPNFQKWH
jgi:hypothetical protein